MQSNGGDSVMWTDAVAICMDQLSGVALVCAKAVGGAGSTVAEASVPSRVGY